MSTTEHRLPVKLLSLVGIAAIVVAAAGYTLTGAPKLALNPPQPAAAEPGAKQMAELVERLAQRMKDKPEDPQGWAMLGRSYMMLERPADAVKAFRESLKRKADDADVLADTAVAVATVANGVTDEAEALLEQALKLQPDNPKVLSAAGSAAFDRGDWTTAVKHWERIIALAPPGSDYVAQVQAGIDEARKRGGLPPSTASAGGGAAPTAQAAASTAITGRVTLAAALKAQAAPDDTVFVFARAAEGSRMPLAIVRRQVKDLPFDFVLDDSSAMSPATRLSATAGPVIVGARISKSGNAMPQPGDLSGQAGPLAPGASGVAVEIGQAVPAAAR